MSPEQRRQRLVAAGVDLDALAEAKALLDEQAEALIVQRHRGAPAKPKPTDTNRLCRTCGRDVTGERIYCGPCLAERLRLREKADG